MKTFILSKKDLAYLAPLDATMQGLNVAIQVYVINTIFKRLSIDPNTKARYDIDRGELYVMEEKDLKPQEKVEPIPKRAEEKQPVVKKEPVVKN